MRRIAVFLLLSILSAPALADVLIKNARIVDPAAETITRGAIVIEGERIARVLDEAPPIFDGQVLDADGAYVIPGLYDMHVHFGVQGSPRGGSLFLGGEKNAHLMLFAGMAGFLDVTSASEERRFGLRAELASGELLGPTAFVAGGITTPLGHGTEFGSTRDVESAEEAAQELSDLVAQRRPDVLKLHYQPYSRSFPTFELDVLTAIIRGADEAGIKTVVHVDTWQGALDTVEAGASAITHVPIGPIPQTMISALKRHGTVWIPTLSVQTGLPDYLENDELLSRPFFVALTEGLGGAYKRDAFLPARLRRYAAAGRQKRQTLLHSVAAAARAGVPIAAGSDAGNVGTFQGYSIHREMALYVEAGLSPWEALRSATTTAGEFLGVPVGVKPGDLASLVLLSDSPIENIENTENIAAMIHRGKIVDRGSLLGE